MKRLVSVALCAVLLITLLTGCMPSKAYSYDNLTMDIPINMQDYSGQAEFKDYDFVLANLTLTIIGQQDRVSGYDNETDYAHALINANDLFAYPQVRIADNGSSYAYYFYESTAHGVSDTILVGCFRGTDHFWIVQLCTNTDRFNPDTLLGYLDTVVVS